MPRVGDGFLGNARRYRVCRFARSALQCDFPGRLSFDPSARLLHVVWPDAASSPPLAFYVMGMTACSCSARYGGGEETLEGASDGRGRPYRS